MKELIKNHKWKLISTLWVCALAVLCVVRDISDARERDARNAQPCGCTSCECDACNATPCDCSNRMDLLGHQIVDMDDRLRLLEANFVAIHAGLSDLQHASVHHDTKGQQ